MKSLNKEKKDKNLDLEECLSLTDDENLDLEESLSSSEDEKVLNEQDKQRYSWRMTCLVGLLFLVFYMFIGCEHGYSNFLYSYAHLYFNFEVNWAAYLNSTFGFVLAIGRLVGIFGAPILKPNSIVLIDIICCLIAFALMVILPKSTAILWINTIIYGFFLASLYPAGIDWAQLHLRITRKILTVLIAGGAAGASTIPLLIGYLFNNQIFGPFVLIVISLIIMIIALLFYICAFRLTLNL